MRQITISAISLFGVLPAVAGTRLPVVNVASGGVSARSAFGEELVVATEKKQVAKPTRAKKVVARSAKKTVTPVAADSGEKIIASNDVLVPRRPSNDLWAKNDAPLRMPSPSEFSVIRSDSLLPEESLDRVAVVNTKPSKVVAPVIENNDEDLDAQIARLVNMRRASEQVAPVVSSRVISAPVAQKVATPVAPVQVADAAPKTLRRLVVPMDDDVIVRKVADNASPTIAAVRDDMTKMSPAELRRAFRKTFLSENKHISTYQTDSRFDVASDMSSGAGVFSAERDLSEDNKIRTLEVKIKFRDDDSALSRDNYSTLSELAAIVVNKPTRAIQVAIPQRATTDKDARKLAARRLAIVEQVLRDNGVSEQRIVPVLSQRNEDGFVLRVLTSEQYETLTQQKRDIFGDVISTTKQKSMSW